jgi:hypothetical protein
VPEEITLIRPTHDQLPTVGNMDPKRARQGTAPMDPTPTDRAHLHPRVAYATWDCKRHPKPPRSAPSFASARRICDVGLQTRVPSPATLFPQKDGRVGSQPDRNPQNHAVQRTVRMTGAEAGTQRRQTAFAPPPGLRRDCSTGSP